MSKWRCHCFNEPDISKFFMSELSNEMFEERAKEYYAMYESFVKGVRRVSDKIPVGGPALASRDDFLEAFLKRVKEGKLPMDFISLHHYGCAPWELNAGKKKLCVDNLLEKHRRKMEIINRCGFGNVSILIDEWGAASHGYYNREECPMLMFRESEEFAAYYARLIHDVVYSDMKIEKMMICLSGQHEMTEDFSGFRNFFTLNFIRKPIYNAHILAAKLHEGLLKEEHSTENLFVVPTKNEKGEYSVLLTYASECFEEDIPAIEESVTFEEDIKGKQVTVWCIDKNTTNPYRCYQKFGVDTLNDEQIQMLREEGNLKPVLQEEYNGQIKLNLTPNCTYLITIGEKL